eukprot:5446369-Pyramimonas_sp.AAC.1
MRHGHRTAPCAARRSIALRSATCDSFARRSSHGRLGLILILRKTSFCSAPQEPTKVATVSQFAAPRDGEAELCFP